MHTTSRTFCYMLTQGCYIIAVPWAKRVTQAKRVTSDICSLDISGALPCKTFSRDKTRLSFQLARTEE